MLSPRFPYIVTLLFFLISCENQPLTYNDSDVSLSVDTVSFDVIESTTYQVPPLMGGARY